MTLINVFPHFKPLKCLNIVFSKFFGVELNDPVASFQVSRPTTLEFYTPTIVNNQLSQRYSRLFFCHCTCFLVFSHSLTSAWNALICIAHLENGPYLSRARRIYAPVKFPFVSLLLCRLCCRIPNTFLLLFGTEQNISQPHLLFEMATEGEWKQCVHSQAWRVNSSQLWFSLLFSTFRWLI